MKVEIIKGTAFELDPEKKYLLLIDPSEVTKEVMSIINKVLRAREIDNIVVGVNPKAVKIVEAK